MKSSDGKGRVFPKTNSAGVMAFAGIEIMLRIIRIKDAVDKFILE